MGERTSDILEPPNDRSSPDAEWRRGDDVALLSFMLRCGRSDPALFRRFTARGEQAMRQGRHERAEPLLRLAALTRPSDGAAWRRYAGSLERLSEFAAAAGAWRRAIALDQNDATALYGLGRAEAGAGRHGEARAALEAAFAIDPGLPGLDARLVEAEADMCELAGRVLSSPWSRGGARKALIPSRLRYFRALRRARLAAAEGGPRRAASIYARLAERSHDPAELIGYGDAIASLIGPAAARGAYLKAYAVRPDDGRSRRRATDVRHGTLGLVARPAADLTTNPDGSYVTLSDDAQIALDPDGRAFPAGWTYLSLAAVAPAAPIRPVIYAFHGQRGEQVTAFTLPLIEGSGEVQCVLPLPDGVTRLRLDPTGHAGVSFGLSRVGWLAGRALDGKLFVPAPEDSAFVGEDRPIGSAALPATTAFSLQPLHDLALIAGGGFVSTGDDPQFDVEGAPGALSGWTWIDVRIEAVETPLDPLLYAWTEDEVVTFNLPVVVGPFGHVGALVRLPDRISRLRFDPACHAAARFGPVTFRAAPMPTGEQVLIPCPVGPGAEPVSLSSRPTDLVRAVRPVDAVRALNDGRYRMTAPAARFAVEPIGGDLGDGVFRMTLRIDAADRTIEGVLYVVDDTGIDLHAYHLGDVEPGEGYEYHLALPARGRLIRFGIDNAMNVALTVPQIGLVPLDGNDDASYVVARCEAQPSNGGLGTVEAGLQPIQHLEEQDGGFRSTGHDPQFHVALGGAFPRGWTAATVEMDVADTLARPILYVWSGTGVTPLQLASLGAKGRVSQLIYLPDDVSAMRLDPTDVAGTCFSAPRLTFSPPSLLAGRLLQRVPNTGRRVDYEAWCDLYDRIGPVDRVLIGEAIGHFQDTPLISVLMPVYAPDPRFLRRALDTVIDQLYPHWELCIAEDCSPSEDIRDILREYSARDERIKIVFREDNGHISRASNSALELVTGDFVALMDHDDELPPHALYLVADEINRFPDVDIIYTDEDKIDQNGRRHDPYFKNDWNRELFYSQNCVAHMGVYRTELIRKVGGFRAGFEGSQDYDLTLRILYLTSDERIRHIPHVLYHWRIFAGVSTFSSDNPANSVNSAKQALDEYFALAEPESEVQPIPYFPSWWRIRRPLPARPPSVTIVIPTRDRVELVRNCLDGILERTDYTNLDVIIVDNGSTQPETLGYFAAIVQDPRVRVLRDDGPFNYSRLNNVAVAEATGDYLCFLNNDIETISPDWLAEMVSQAVRPGVGAVGTRLLYASGTLQHAGVTLGVYGIAAHGHRHFPGDSIGYFGHPQLVREVSAVTAAALLMNRRLFEAIGGFDETNLAISYNDVDLCLRIREAGYKVVYTPFAALYHLESASRGQDSTFEQKELQRVERGYMEARWEGVIGEDPFYSRNLTLTNEDCDLAFPPRARKPWLQQADVAGKLARAAAAALPAPDDEAISALAADTAIVIAGAAPFAMLARVSALLAHSRPRPGVIVLVDSMPRNESFVGTGGAAAFREACSDVPLIIVDDHGQDYLVAHAADLGLAQVPPEHGHVVVIAEDCELAGDWFAALLRAWLAMGGADVLLSPRMFIREGRPHNGVFVNGYIELPARQTAADPSAIRTMGGGFADLPAGGRLAPAEVTDEYLLQATELPGAGLVLARVATLRAVADGDGMVFDPLILTRGALFEDLALRLATNGVSSVATTAALAVLPAPRPRDSAHLWQHEHDYVWLNRKAYGPVENGVVEFVCPFHRGDVLVGLQVANTAHRAGIQIRFHVAQDLVEWVLAFDPPFAVRSVPVGVPSAERTALHLLRAYEHVVRQPESGPRFARSHFARGLDAMRGNLAGAMLASVGLSPETPMEALRPPTSPDEEEQAAAMLAPYGDRVVLFHRAGGWGLKTLPEAELRRFAATVTAGGYRLVQIGGPGELACEEAAGMIAGNFAPGLWAALFRKARAIAGVDSWTAHMAGLLDVPQITFFGSTHPDHVASKPYFRARGAPALLIGPTVACSPCNSLVCLIQPEPFCPGYSADPGLVSSFLRGVNPTVDALQDEAC